MAWLKDLALQLEGRHGRDILDMAQYLSTGSDPDINSKKQRSRERDPNPDSSKWKKSVPSPGIVHLQSESPESPPVDIFSNNALLEHLFKSANVSRNTRDTKKTLRTALPSSSQKRTIKFTLPSLPIVILTLGGLAMLTFLSFTQSENSFVQWVFWAIPQGVFRFSAKALLVVHILEAVVMMLACRSLRKRSSFIVDAPAMILYIASTLVFGIFAGLALVRNIPR